MDWTARVGPKPLSQWRCPDENRQRGPAAEFSRGTSRTGIQQRATSSRKTCLWVGAKVKFSLFFCCERRQAGPHGSNQLPWLAATTAHARGIRLGARGVGDLDHCLVDGQGQATHLRVHVLNGNLVRWVGGYFLCDTGGSLLLQSWRAGTEKSLSEAG